MKKGPMENGCSVDAATKDVVMERAKTFHAKAFGRERARAISAVFQFRWHVCSDVTRCDLWGKRQKTKGWTGFFLAAVCLYYAASPSRIGRSDVYRARILDARQPVSIDLGRKLRDGLRIEINPQI